MDQRYQEILNKLGQKLDAIELPSAEVLALTQPVPHDEVKAANEKLILAAQESKQKWIQEGLSFFGSLAQMYIKSQTGGLA